MELPSRQTEPWSNPSAAAVEEEDFRTARRLGVILIVLQAIILHLLSGARLFPAVAVGLACGIGAMQRRWHLDRLTFQLLCVVTAIGFLLHFLISPFPFPEESLFLRTPLAHSIARFLIGLQLLGLAVRQPSGRPPLWLAGLGAMCLPFAANIQLRESRHSALLFWIAAFVAVAALYSSYVRRRIAAASQPAGAARRFVVTAALIGSILLGSGSALALRRYDRHIESFLRDFLGEGLGMARSGFSPSGRLNDVLAWKTNDADHVAMRVFADRAPGYLRGKAFDTYQAPEWESGWRSWSTELRMKPLRSAIAVRGLPPVRNGELVYELISGAGETLTRLDIWPEPQLRGCVFAPLGAAYVASSHHVACDAHGNLTTEDSEQMLPYTVFAAPSRPDEQLSDAMRALLTVLDPDIDPALRRLADNLFADCPTPRAKINRIQSWFRENFSYRLGVRIPRGADPLTYFLMARPPAHCEFFATGTAVLLKLADVPCRYVAGYVATEENAVGGYWIVRNQDAHAWVEAYDEEFRQWLVVDSTPAAGIPTRRDNTIPSQLADTFQ
ncbi:MAG: transglutaminaseTgpA domain-containing protein, partial [Planctomycetaceae bacterium]